MEAEILNVREAAAFLRVSVGTLNNLRTYGGGPKFARVTDKPGSRVTYHIDELRRWRAAREVASTSGQTPE